MSQLPRRELGSYPPDYEPWFERWNSVMFYPNPTARKLDIFGWSGESGTLPCHEHKTCKSKVLAKNPYPPRVCPGCGIDTLVEQGMIVKLEKRIGA
jgi:hypothetical protein